MNKTYQISIRVALAFFIAAVADALQFGVGWLTNHWVLPGEIADFVLDLIVAGTLSLLIGFHPIFLPSFILKAVQIPLVEDIPSWTACVTYLTWSQKRKSSNDTQSEGKQPETQTLKDKPKPTARRSIVADYAGNPNVRHLFVAASLLTGLIWFAHRPPGQSKRLPAYADAREVSPPPVRPAPASPPPPPSIPVSKGSNLLVAVGPIENQSGVGQINTSPEKMRTFIEQMLREINGVHVLERLQTQFFVTASKGLGVGQMTKPPAEMLPNLVVLVAIIDIHNQTSNFRGYDITAKSAEIQCSLRLQVMDMSDGSITFSRILTGERTLMQTSASDTTSTEDGVFVAIKSALRKIDGDNDFDDAVRGVKNEQIQVEFAPKPNHCDIEIDGHYIGGSPLTQKLLSGHEVTIRISKAGYNAWQGRILPRAGMQVTRELEPVK